MRRRAKKHISGKNFEHHRERLGEWAVTLVLALAVGLWFCWPKGVYRRSEGVERRPEPAASYVEVSLAGDSLMYQSRAFGGRTQRGSLREPPMALLSQVTPSPGKFEPQYLALSKKLLKLPDPLPVAIPQLPDLIWRDAAFAPQERLAERVPEGMFVEIGSALAAAGYKMSEAPALPDTSPSGELLFYVVLDETGRVANIWCESQQQNGGDKEFRRCLLSTAGTNAATGTVRIEW